MIEWTTQLTHGKYKDNEATKIDEILAERRNFNFVSFLQLVNEMLSFRYYGP